VRVDQAGYPPAASKTEFVMLPRAVGSVRFVVADPHGGVRLTGRSTDDLGRWNAGYGAAYKLDFTDRLLEHSGHRTISSTPSGGRQHTSFITQRSREIPHRKQPAWPRHHGQGDETMRWGVLYRRSGNRAQGALFPFLCLLMIPLIAAAFTIAFLGYALWRLGYLSWQSMCLAWQAMRARRILARHDVS
jgi:hypothetical protein